MGGGGSSPKQTTQNVNQSNVPEYLRPYVERNVGMAEGLVNSAMDDGYQTYGNDRLAGFTDLQNQAMGHIGGLGYGLGEISAKGAGYQTVQGATTDYDPTAGLEQFQMDGVGDVGTQRWIDDGVAESYMSPYMQNVVDIQKREADRDAAVMGQQRNAQLARAGAYGGSRQAIMQSEADRNLMQQMGDIQATGLQQAWEQGMGQFNQDTGRELQADLANQQTGYNVGSTNLQALLGTQELGAGLANEVELANLANRQQAQMGNQQASLQASIANQQADLEAQRLQEAARQAYFDNNVSALQYQMDVGNQQQAHEQASLDLAYQDFLNQQRYPYEQVGYMNDILRGQPTASSYATTAPAANTYSQYLGGGLGALALQNAVGGGGGGGST